jgi:TPR repeat protein
LGRGRTSAARYDAGSTGDAASRLYNQSLDCLEGRGVPKDERKAFVLNQRAAYLGHGDAILAMGWFYNHGVGVELDDVQSLRWYREAARLGDERAMFSIGAISLVLRDLEEAHVWLRRAVEAGHARAGYYLGKMYWRGTVVSLDRKRAMQLFQDAAAAKVEEARRFLRLYSRLRRRAR